MIFDTRVNGIPSVCKVIVFNSNTGWSLKNDK